MSVTSETVFNRFRQAMARLFTDGRPKQIAVAVSGGSDSLATLVLAKRWCDLYGTTCRAVTVDHALRPSSKSEAETVVGLANSLGIVCDILTWAGEKPFSNIQAEARQARYALIADWRGSIQHVLTGHTINDQAETFLLRLKRGSGVDGLSAMSERRDMGGWSLLRPCLGLEREDLRCVLKEQGIAWIDDPSNDNDKFDRVQMRKLLPQFEQAGLTPETFAKTCERMTRAQDALNFYVRQLAKDAVSQEYGDVLIDVQQFQNAPAEIRYRLVAATVSYIAQTIYKPRFSTLRESVAAALGGRAATFSGVVLFMHRGKLRATREYNAIKNMRGSGPFDGRWVLPLSEGQHIQALGPEQAVLLDKRVRKSIPHKTLVSQPAIFKREILVFTPTLDGNSNKGATFCSQDFFHWLNRH